MKNRWGNSGNSNRLYFGGSKITADRDCSHKIKTLAPWKKSYDQARQHIKKQRHYFANKGLSRQGYGFSSSHVWMWELDYKESWALTLWTITCQASLSITNSWSLLKLMSIISVMPLNHLILCHPLLLLPPIPPSIRVFSNELALHIRWPSIGVSA